MTFLLKEYLSGQSLDQTGHSRYIPTGHPDSPGNPLKG
jgi:hypothetical protein